MTSTDLLIVGAGPAGMAAAIMARKHGLSVVVLDEQPAPGGQIWRSVEMAARRNDILGPSFSEGRAVVEDFRASGVVYYPDAKIWQIERGFRVYFTREGKAQSLEAKALILATGAQERPVPFPGWTLPGVLTVGAAQILLKNAGQIPAEPVWIAGSGPLPLLYLIQLIRAGGQIAGYLDTTPAGQWRSALRHLPRALRSAGELLKGLKWQATLRSSGVRVVKGVTDVEALGDQKMETLRYRTADGAAHTVKAGVLLVHEGVVPHLHAALSMDCRVAWDSAQDCNVPVLDGWGESSEPRLFIAGDGAGIAGAKAALLRGEIAALRIAAQLGRVSEATVRQSADVVRRKLDRELAVRPFLDAMFRPRQQVFTPADETIVCRCEEITAGQIRALANVGRPGPSQIKTATRTGMGPCQGRQCGYTLTRLLAEAQGRHPSDVGYIHIRPPLKPVTIGELASLNEGAPVEHPSDGGSE
jgi:NADPH-dependent 2,4-dienoyl-CoA reductase/sulfur reductase-like enzyme